MSTERNGRIERPDRDVRELPGYADALQGLGSVAAPLLAGFSLTLVVYTLTATEAFRWPNAVLVPILGAALSLLVSVQCTMIARLFLSASRATPEEDNARLAAAHRLWARRTEKLYNAGILLLLFGITVALVPPGPLGEMGARLAAIALGLLGLAGVAAWMGAERPPARWIASRFLIEPDHDGFHPRTRVGE